MEIVPNSPTSADLDGDGLKEVLIGAVATYALRGTDGSTIWSYSGPNSGYQANSRKIGDIDNDGEIEVILTGAGYGPITILDLKVRL